MTQPHISDIQRVVAVQFGLSTRDLLGPCQARRYSRPRQVAMYLTRELTDCSWAEIGEFFEGRDHSTVIHAHRAIGALMERDSGVKFVVDMIWDNLRKRTERE